MKSRTASRTSNSQARKASHATRASVREALKRARGKGAVDYVAVAIAYAEDAIADTKRERYGKWIRLAAKRFIGDLKRAQKKRAPFVFSPERANHVCAWIEQLPHVEEVWSETNLIELEPAQIFFLVQLFGFRKHDGTRRFTTALFAVARKNAKSTLAAAILLYCLCEEPGLGPQIISAATTGQQARIVWNVAKRMVDRTSDLREAYGVETFANSIVRYENGGNFRPINAKASTQDGLNPSALSFDELHAHKTHDLFNVLRSAAGARKDPLFLYTTTEGYENPGPWAEERRFAEQVLEEVVEADHYLAIIYAVDDEDDDFDESKWIKANPLLDVSIAIDKLREAATEAKQKPGSLAEFRIKRLNRRASGAQGCINLTRWRRCSGPVLLEDLEGCECWAAFDLASTTDMNSWRLLWRRDGHFFTWGRFWVPEDAIAQRTERGTVPYARWVEQGLITRTPGDTTDYDLIGETILRDIERFRPKQIAYDSWNAGNLVQYLQNGTEELAGIPLDQLLIFIQSFKAYNPAWKAFELAYLNRKLSHGGDEVLTWQASNLVPRYDQNMNFAPDKKRTKDKIDGICTLLMCFGLADADRPDEPVSVPEDYTVTA